MRDILPEDEQFRIAMALHRLCVAKKLPAVWIDGNRVGIEARRFERHAITWSQAARLAAGEPLDSVVQIRKGPGSARPVADESEAVA